MSANFTPGPWRVGDAGATVFGPPNGEPSPRIIANVGRGAFPSITTKANARLIAAAPALYEALMFIVNDAPEGEDAQLTVAGYNRACAALAQAEGRAET